MDFKHFVVI